MSEWKMANSALVWQCTFGRKVGHVVHDTSNDRWLALFDGVYLGDHRNETDARYEVELASRFQLPSERPRSDEHHDSM